MSLMTNITDNKKYKQYAYIKQTNKHQTTSKEMAPADGKQSLATAEKTLKKYSGSGGIRTQTS